MPLRGPQSYRDADAAFAQAMEREQEKQGLSDARLGGLSDVAPAAIWKIKHAKPPRRVTVGEAESIAYALGFHGIDAMLKGNMRAEGALRVLLRDVKAHDALGVIARALAERESRSIHIETPPV